MEVREVRQRYFIPDNFIEEGHVFLGKFKLRYFVEAILFSGVFALVALLIVFNLSVSFQARVAIIIAFVIPPFCLGIIGYNGDPLSVALKSALSWNKNKAIMLYNPHPRLLAEDPMKACLESERAKDKLVELYDAFQARRNEGKANIKMVEGEDFTFASDPDIDMYTLEKKIEEEKLKQQKEAKKAKKRKPKKKGDVDDMAEIEQPTKNSQPQETSVPDFELVVDFSSDSDLDNLFSDSDPTHEIDFGAEERNFDDLDDTEEVEQEAPGIIKPDMDDFLDIFGDDDDDGSWL